MGKDRLVRKKELRALRDIGFVSPQTTTKNSRLRLSIIRASLPIFIQCTKTWVQKNSLKRSHWNSRDKLRNWKGFKIEYSLKQLWHETLQIPLLFPQWLTSRQIPPNPVLAQSTEGLDTNVDLRKLRMVCAQNKTKLERNETKLQTWLTKVDAWRRQNINHPKYHVNHPEEQYFQKVKTKLDKKIEKLKMDQVKFNQMVETEKLKFQR